jgi:hypothetical protein
MKVMLVIMLRVEMQSQLVKKYKKLLFGQTLRVLFRECHEKGIREIITRGLVTIILFVSLSTLFQC